MAGPKLVGPAKGGPKGIVGLCIFPVDEFESNSNICKLLKFIRIQINSIKYPNIF
jgi:hypothetical protein